MNFKETAENIRRVSEQQPAKSPVVANAPKIKKSFRKKLREALTHDDKESIGDYLIFSVLLPNLLDTASDILHNATDSIIYGIGETSSRSKRRGAAYNKVDNVSYSRPSASTTLYNSYGKIDIDEVNFRTKVDADRVLLTLRNDIEMYNHATVCAFKEEAGVEPQYIAPIDHDYGWYNLDGARPQSTRDGYILVMPKPVPIRRK